MEHAVRDPHVPYFVRDGKVYLTGTIVSFTVIDDHSLGWQHSRILSHIKQ